MTIDIYFRDLAESVQEQLLDAYGIKFEDTNWDLFPITTIELEES